MRCRWSVQAARRARAGGNGSYLVIPEDVAGATLLSDAGRWAGDEFRGPHVSFFQDERAAARKRRSKRGAPSTRAEA